MNNRPDGIVLLHGIFRTHRNMAKLAQFLADNGFRTLNLSYPSTRKPIENIVEHVHEHIRPFAESLEGKLHFVVFSLGCLVTRAYIHRFRPQNLGRVVMLGPPNQGSEVADALKNWGLYRKLYGPAGQQLVTGLAETDGLFGVVDYELGVIAGNRSIDPISSYIIGKPSDGKVSVESTRVTSMRDHIVIPAVHTFFPQNRTAWRHVLHFLEEGRFGK